MGAAVADRGHGDDRNGHADVLVRRVLRSPSRRCRVGAGRRRPASVSPHGAGDDRVSPLRSDGPHGDALGDRQRHRDGCRLDGVRPLGGRDGRLDGQRRLHDIPAVHDRRGVDPVPERAGTASADRRRADRRGLGARRGIEHDRRRRRPAASHLRRSVGIRDVDLGAHRTAGAAGCIRAARRRDVGRGARTGRSGAAAAGGSGRALDRECLAPHPRHRCDRHAGADVAVCDRSAERGSGPVGDDRRDRVAGPVRDRRGDVRRAARMARTRRGCADRGRDRALAAVESAGGAVSRPQGCAANRRARWWRFPRASGPGAVRPSGPRSWRRPHRD